MKTSPSALALGTLREAHLRFLGSWTERFWLKVAVGLAVSGPAAVVGYVYRQGSEDRAGGMVILLLGVLLASWSGGFVGGVTAGLVGLVATLYLFAGVDENFKVGPDHLAPLAVYLSATLLVNGFNFWRRLVERELTDTRAQLEEANIRLQEAISAKDEFLGILSHEARNPLTSVSGNVSLLLRRYEFLPDETRRQVLADLDAETRRLQRIMESILDLARLDLGQEPQLSNLNLQRALNDTIDLFKARCPSREVLLDVDCPNATVRANEGYVEEILFNLLTNADKYSPQETAIEVRASSEDDSMHVSVLDCGSGFPADLADKLFEPFYREERLSGGSSGLGLGLTVCKRLAEAQKGRIWATARDGGGASVTFSLPLAHAPEESVLPADDPGHPRASRRSQVPSSA